MSVSSEELFTEVEMNRPGYSPSRECGEVDIVSFSPTLQQQQQQQQSLLWLNKITNITPPASSKASRGRRCVGTA